MSHEPQSIPANYLTVKLQVLTLCLKALKVHKGLICLVFGIFFIWSVLTLYLNNSINVAYIVFPIVLLEGLLLREDNYKTDSLFCSLPIHRASLVLSRYLTAVLVLAAVLCVTYLSVLTIKAVPLPGSETPARLITGSLVLVLIFIYTVFAGVILHNNFRFGFLGYPKALMIDIFVGLVILALTWGALYSAASLVGNSWELASYLKVHGFMGYFDGITIKCMVVFGKNGYLTILSVLIPVVFVISGMLSIKYFKRRDL